MRAMIAAAALVCMLPTTLSAKCAKEPALDFVERPFNAAEPDGGRVETITVDGKAWTKWFWKSAIPGIMRYGVLADCRVYIVGRKGLSNYVVIDDVEWKHPVHNSSWLAASRDGSKVLHASPDGEMVLNDVPQTPVSEKLVSARFLDNGDLETKWDLDGKTVTAINGKIVDDL